MQDGYVNFYSRRCHQSLCGPGRARPLGVTLNGAVLYDCGGYGMLGFGHTPKPIIEAMAKPQVMANIMTPNLSQLRFDRAPCAMPSAKRAAVVRTRNSCA